MSLSNTGCTTSLSIQRKVNTVGLLSCMFIQMHLTSHKVYLSTSAVWSIFAVILSFPSYSILGLVSLFVIVFTVSIANIKVAYVCLFPWKRDADLIP